MVRSYSDTYYRWRCRWWRCLCWRCWTVLATRKRKENQNQKPRKQTKPFHVIPPFFLPQMRRRRKDLCSDSCPFNAKDCIVSTVSILRHGASIPIGRTFSSPSSTMVSLSITLTHVRQGTWEKTTEKVLEIRITRTPNLGYHSLFTILLWKVKSQAFLSSPSANPIRLFLRLLSRGKIQPIKSDRYSITWTFRPGYYPTRTFVILLSFVE